METILYLAPIRGITDAAYRDVFARYFTGFDLAMAPFLTTYQGNRIKPARLAELLPENNRRLPLTPQILARNPDNFIAVSRILCDMGYETINWNLGCPYPMVANKLRGSGLLPFPEKIEAFLEKACSLPCSISIKTRLGRKDSSEIFKLLPVFNKFPLAEVVIHPRTGVQMYKGTVDLDTFERCLPLCNHPVVYNGDITNKASFITLQQRFPSVSRWMIGRGALANPFLPSEVKGIAHTDEMRTVAAFHDELFLRYDEMLSGSSHLLGRMKGLWFYLAGSFENDKKILKKIQKTKTIERYSLVCKEIFAEAAWKSSSPNEENYE